MKRALARLRGDLAAEKKRGGEKKIRARTNDGERLPAVAGVGGTDFSPNFRPLDQTSGQRSLG
jgi:hypothetical protein